VKNHKKARHRRAFFRLHSTLAQFGKRRIFAPSTPSFSSMFS